MKKLFYILPEYEETTSMHFRYNLEFLGSLAQEGWMIFLYIEKGEMPKNHGLKKVVLGRHRSALGRFVERLALFSWARLQGYQIFYAHYGTLSSIVASLLCRASRGKSLYWHCEERNNYELQNCFTCLPQKMKADWPFYLTLRLCNKLVTCTEPMKRYYHESFRIPYKKIHVVPNWVDLSPIPIQTEKSIEILFVHWLSPRKGTRLLPEFFQEVHQVSPHTHLTLIGDGPDFDFLREEWKKRKLETWVDMKGPIPNREISAYYQKAKVLIHPSREEEFGRVLIEAMANRLPIVASQTRATQAVLSKSQKAFTFPYDNPKKAAQLILHILARPQLRTKLEKEGLKQVKRFSREVALERFKRLLEKEERT